MVKEWTPKLRDRELALKCNAELGTSFTTTGMKAFRANYGYQHTGKKQLDGEYWKWQTDYPKGMYEFIRDNSKGITSKKMAEMTNEKFGTSWTAAGMKQFRRRYGINSGLTGQFRKGQKAWNKGKKITEFVSPETIEKIHRTTFKKGDRPANELPLGTVSINAEGYKLRKKNMTGSQWERWEFLHRAVWEEHNGPIPENMVIIFKDGNRQNCEIGNLMMVSKSENAILNRYDYRSDDPDLTEAAAYAIRMMQTAKNRKKKYKAT